MVSYSASEAALARRFAVGIIFILTIIEAIIGIFLILSRKKLTRIKKIELFICISFILHSAFGIAATVDMHYNRFDKATHAKFIISCGFSIIYMALTMIPISIKLRVMNFTFWKPTSIISGILFTAFKIAAFVRLIQLDLSVKFIGI
jgi:hypothetical protein